MSRGRKPKASESNLSWQQIFNKNVGKYLQYAIIELGKEDSDQTETGADLLQKIKAEKGKNKKEKELPPVKAEEIPYKIPDNWVWCRLGEMSINCDGARIPVSQSERDKKEKVYDYYGASGAIDKIDGYTHDGKYLLIGEDGANLIAKSTPIAFIAEGKFWVNNHAHVLDFIDNTTMNFMEYCLNSIDINPFITGGFQPKLSQGNLNMIPIPLPPLSEQEKIVAFLHDFENDNLKEDGYYFNREVEEKVIALHEAQLKGFEISAQLTCQLSLVKKLRQQLLQDAVQGKLVDNSEAAGESAHELLKRIKAEKEQLIKEKKLKKEKELPPIKAEEIPFEIPEDWVWCRLGEICTKIGSGSTPNGSNYASEGVPFFRSQNIHNNGLVYDDIKFITDDIQKQMNGTTVYANDILLNITGGSMGRCALVPNDFEEGNVSQHVCIIRPLHANVDFCHRLILSPFFQQNIFSSTTGAGREGLPKYNLEQFLIPLPPLSTQRLIVEKVDSLMQLCDGLEASIGAGMRENEQLLQQVLREALQG